MADRCVIASKYPLSQRLTAISQQSGVTSVKALQQKKLCAALCAAEFEEIQHEAE